MDIDKFLTGFMGGLADGFSLAHLVVFLLLGVFILMAYDDFRLSIKALLFFVVSYFIVAFGLRVGLFAEWISSVYYSRLITIFYSVVGLLCMYLGGILAVTWFRVYSVDFQGGPFIKILNPRGIFSFLLIPLSLFLGMLFAVAGYSWPIVVAVQAMSNEIFMPGLLWPTFWALLIYEAVFVFLMALFFFVVRHFLAEKRKIFFIRRRSLLLSIFSGIYMSIGAGLLLIFLNN